LQKHIPKDINSWPGAFGYFKYVLDRMDILLGMRVEKLCTDPEKSDEEYQEDLINCFQDNKLIQ